MLEVRELTKTYLRGQAEVRALRGISCTIPEGRVTFVVGPSGSGKSTLLYLLGTLDQPTSGEVLLRGKTLSGLTTRERDRFRRDEVGFVFQNFNLIGNLDCVENVLIPYMPRGISETQRQNAMELLKRVGLGERLDHRPSQLSGGEQQRVALVRALLKKPVLVLADEPTGELDSATGGEVFQYLRELCAEQGSTVVVVTHDRTHIREEDHVIRMRDGQIDATNS
ncbi:MAG: ABC transporter ATP-binding protein [Planctomycetales bacterium]